MPGRSPPPALTAPRGYPVAIPPWNTYNRSRHLNIEARHRQPGVVVKQLGDVVKHEANVVKQKGDVVKHEADVVKHKGDVNNQRLDFVNQGQFFSQAESFSYYFYFFALIRPQRWHGFSSETLK